MDTHTIFIVSVVVIIVIFILVLLATIALSGESFKDLTPFLPMTTEKRENNEVIDPYVPQNIRFRDATKFYEGLDDGLKGTSLVNVSEILTNRYPIAIETSTNWYSTQPLIGNEISLGTNEGKLPKSMCGCKKN